MPAGPKTEAPEYSGFLRRCIRAMSRRAGEGDLESLAAMLAVRADLDTAIGEAARAAQATGYSWTEIAAATGMTRQAARQRWAA